MVRCTDRSDMTIAVDWDVKNQKIYKKNPTIIKPSTEAQLVETGGRRVASSRLTAGKIQKMLHP